MTEVLFVLSIFVAIWMGTVIFMRFIRRQSVHALNFILFAVSVTSIITKALGMW